MTLIAYLDESTDKYQQASFVLAGFISSDANWSLFSSEWKKLSFEKYGNHEFKLSTTKLEGKKFQEYYSIVQDHVLFSLGCIIDIKVYNEALSEAKCEAGLEFYKERLKKNESIYFVASRILLHYFTDVAHRINISEAVDFVFDNLKCSEQLLLGWNEAKSNQNNQGLELVNSVASGDSKTIMPLQAADLIAGLIQRSYTSGMLWNGRIPKNAYKREIQGLFFTFEKNALKDEIEFILGKENWQDGRILELKPYLEEKTKTRAEAKAKRMANKKLKIELECI